MKITTLWQMYVKAVIKKALHEITAKTKTLPDRMPVQIMITIVPEGYEGQTSYVIRRSYTISKEAFNDTASQSESAD